MGPGKCGGDAAYECGDDEVSGEGAGRGVGGEFDEVGEWAGLGQCGEEGKGVLSQGLGVGGLRGRC